MDAAAYVSRVLDDEGLTDGLNDPEARMLIEWLVAEVELIAEELDSEPAIWREVEDLCRRMRGIRRFISLWCHKLDHGAAAQLVAAERFHWPLPPADELEPCQIMERILSWEQTHRRGDSFAETWDR
jgi:hypothetical protein